VEASASTFSILATEIPAENNRKIATPSLNMQNRGYSFLKWSLSMGQKKDGSCKHWQKDVGVFITGLVEMHGDDAETLAQTAKQERCPQVLHKTENWVRALAGDLTLNTSVYATILYNVPKIYPGMGKADLLKIADLQERIRTAPPQRTMSADAVLATAYGSLQLG
jgi:hypothetical protein